MIDPRTIQRFLKQPRDSHTWIKDATDRELMRWLAEELPGNWRMADMMRHQKACLYLGICYPGFAFFLDMGTGKTLVAIELSRYWLWRAKLQRVLVLVPTEPAVWSWQEQIERFAPKLDYRLLLGSSEEKWRRYHDLDRGLAIVTYPGLMHMVSKKMKAKRGNQMVPQLAKIEKLCAKLGGMVLDESTLVANEESLFYRVANQVSKRVTFCYGLAGRPFGRSPMTLWSQMHLVDRGVTFGENSSIFRQAFFKEKAGRFGREYNFRKDRAGEMRKMVRHRSIVYSSSECVTLPKLVPVIRRIGFADEMEGYYERLIEEAMAARGKLQALESLFLRLRQISSGFLGYKDDQTGERSEIEFTENPKLDELMELLSEMPTNRKAVIFHEFTWSGRRICKALTEAKIKHGWIWSGTKDYARMKASFDDPDSGLQVLVVNHRKGGYALNLQAANYVFYFESPVSLIDRDQSDKRCHRNGQLLTVFQYDLVVRGTMDEKILQYHRAGRDLFKALMTEPELVFSSPRKAR